MCGHATAVRSLSQGRVSCSMEPMTFAQAPNRVLTTIMDAASRKPAART
jgi:translation elongation factor EF-G